MMMKVQQEGNNKSCIEIMVPYYNEEASLSLFYKETTSVTAQLTDYDFGFLFIDDGSTDKTLAVIKELRKRDSRVCYISLSRNFGKESAMLAGVDNARGDAVIIMDADLQDPPSLIPLLLA